ncbi:sensor histidine kinase [Actinoplanes sp. CA-142083]|uniref:sensor histidine kinase n=1 Tax=Actinoplanes sp. CA-142083 TaxID=3239903 RepID=UPI003D8B661F
MRSLRVRLLAALAVVSICSIAATAWLAVRTTTRAIRQEQAQALTDDARVYDTLLGYAATHRSWSGAAPLVQSLARSTGHRVALTTFAGHPLLDSGRGALPARPSATVDPLQDLGGGIDGRAVGPFMLPPAEKTALRGLADQVVTCLRTTPAGDSRPAAAPADRVVRHARVVVGPSGRPLVETPGADLSRDDACLRPRGVLAEPTGTERKAIAQLDGLVNACLSPHRVPAVRVAPDFGWRWQDPSAVRAGLGQDAAVDRCLAQARRSQLTPYVAPAALLYLTAPGASPVTGFDLSPANRARIVGVSALVLLVTIAGGALVGGRLARPLRALTGAAQRMRDGDAGARVRVTGNDEIARLGTVFNDMAARRQEVEQLRRDLVGDIAHEMRTPVTNIRGWLEAAEDGVATMDRALVSSLLEEALLLSHILDDLRDLSAADAGELRLHPGPVDVAVLLRQVGRGHRVVAPPGLMVTADPLRLRQAVTNLTTNAVRHSPPGGTVTLSARLSSPWVEIEVADEGPGIAAEDLPLVFERFWRAEKSRSRQTGGSGLGLAITKKLVEAHGGTVTAASPGGAVFTIRLPA